MRNFLKFLLLITLINVNAQTPRSGGINNIQATILNTVHDNFVGVQTTNSNAFAVYDFTTNFNYYLGLKNTDNLAEGSSNKYFNNTLARNAFSAGTGLNYSAGVFSLDSGTQGILSAVANKFNIPNGTNLQYLNGLGNPINFPSIPSAQINSDWNSNSGLSQILNKPSLFSGAYLDLTGKPIIPTDNNQLLNGSGYATGASTTIFTNKSGNISQWTNNSGYLTSITSGQISTALGFNPLSNSRNLTINGLSQDLTADRSWTVGDVTTSTLMSNLLTKENIITSGTVFQYWRGDKTWQTLDKNSVGLNNVDNTSDLNKPISTAAQTALNAKQNTLVSGTNIKTVNGNTLLGSGDLTIGNTYTAGTGISIASNVVTNTAPDQTITLTAGNRISITGTYPNFTIGYVEPTINTPVVRTLNSNFTISSTKQSIVSYTLTVIVTNPLLAGSSTANVFLEYSTNGGTTWLLPSQNGNLSSVALAVAVAITSGQTTTVNGIIPANALVRLRTLTTGTASVTYVTGTEIY